MLFLKLGFMAILSAFHGEEDQPFRFKGPRLSKMNILPWTLSHI